jgi:hypothetical protein
MNFVEHEKKGANQRLPAQVLRSRALKDIFTGMGFSGSFIELNGLPFCTAANTAKERATAPVNLAASFFVY